MRNLILLMVFLISGAPAFAAPGDLDTTFGVAGGYVVTDFSGQQGDSIPKDAAIQADGKIVVAGSTDLVGLSNDFLVARYNADGTLDPTFSGDGIFTLSDTTTDLVESVAIQTDGKIVAVGNSGAASQMYVFRLNANGTLDTTFSGDGIYEIANTGFALSVVIDGGGKILIGASELVNDDAVVVRLNSNGTLDNTFDGNGILTLTQLALVNDLAVQTDGKIVIVGTNAVLSGGDFMTARLNSNGTLDTTFDADGIVQTAVYAEDNEARAVAIQSDGRILVAGGAAASSSDDGAAAIVRYESNGALDATFDGDGIKTQTFLTATENYFVDVAQQSDGKIVAAGDIRYSIIPHLAESFALVRLNADGSPDSVFDANGIALSQWCEDVVAVALQTDGKIVAAGRQDIPNTSSRSFCTQRLRDDGSVDTTFNYNAPNGKITHGFTSVEAIAALPNGKIIVAGWQDITDLFNGNHLYDRAVMIRLNSDGTLDTTFGDEGLYEYSNATNSTYFHGLKVLSDGGFFVAGEGGASIGAFLIKFTPNGIPDSTFSGDGINSTSAINRFYSLAVQTDGKVVGCGSNGSGAAVRSGRLARYSAVGTLESNISVSFGTTGNSEATECGLQSDGKIIVAGYGSDGTSDYAAVERRLSTTLTADATFGTNGLVKTDLSTTLNDRATGLFVQTDNRIVVSSTGSNAGGDTDFAVVRYTSSGALDQNRSENFGTNGVSLINFGTNNNDQATALLVDAAGAMIVGGATNPGNGERFAVTKLNSDGSIRLSFGTLGRAINAFPNNDARINAMALQPDGKIIAAGRTWNGTDYDFAVARYQNNVAMPTATQVSVSGRVLTTQGRGIRSALVTFTDSRGNSLTTLTNAFGYYRFDEIAVGETCVITVAAKNFDFDQPVRVMSVNQEFTDIDFVGWRMPKNYNGNL